MLNFDFINKSNLNFRCPQKYLHLKFCFNINIKIQNYFLNLLNMENLSENYNSYLLMFIMFYCIQIRFFQKIQNNFLILLSLIH